MAISLIQKQPEDITSENQRKIKELESGYAKSLLPNEQENKLQMQLDALQTNTELGINNLRNIRQGVPLSLVQGEKSKIQEQSLAQQGGIQKDLSREQTNRLAQQNYANTLLGFEQQRQAPLLAEQRQIAGEQRVETRQIAGEQRKAEQGLLAEARTAQREKEIKTLEAKMKQDEYKRDLTFKGYQYIKNENDLRTLTDKQIIKVYNPITGINDIYKIPQGAKIENDFQIVGQDANGKNIYGFINKKTQTVTPFNTQINTQTKNVGGYDISSYATDPNYEKAVANILQGIGKFNSLDDVQSYINQVAPNSPITPQMISNTSAKYGVPWEMLAAMMQQDSNLGTAGKGAKTFNPGNVGNDDVGNIRNYGNWQSGVDAVGNWLSNHPGRGQTNLSQQAQDILNKKYNINELTAPEERQIRAELSNAGLTPPNIPTIAEEKDLKAIKFTLETTKNNINTLKDLLKNLNNVAFGPVARTTGILQKVLAFAGLDDEARQYQQMRDVIKESFATILIPKGTGFGLRVSVNQVENALPKLGDTISEKEKALKNLDDIIKNSEDALNSVYGEDYSNVGSNNSMQTSGTTSSGLKYTITP